MYRTRIFAMWLIKVRKQPTTALVIACAAFTVFVSYITLIGCNSICSPKIVTDDGLQGPQSKWYMHEVSTLGALHDAVSRQADNEKQDNGLKETSKSWQFVMEETRTSEAFDYENKLRTTPKQAIPYSTTVTPEPKTNTDAILKNISFAGLMCLMEDYDLNATHFLNWTKKYMLSDEKQSFELHEWVVTGADVCDNSTEVIIIIPSIADRVVDRELIRQTWASSLYGMHSSKMKSNYLRTKLVFTFGTHGLKDFEKVALNREAVRYNDVVAANFLDSYRNLSLKMMLSLSWVNEFCRSAKYVVKVDLDTFVNLPLLNRFLVELSKRAPRYILGHKHTWLHPPVLRSGKWGVSEADYPFAHYPPYVLGHSYVLTADLVHSLVSVGKKLPLIPTEDALITGVLARVIRAPRIHYEGFACIYKKAISCRLVYNYDISLTKMTLHGYTLLWRDLLTNVCSETMPPPKLRSVIQWEAQSAMFRNKAEGLSFRRKDPEASKPWEYFWTH